MAETLTEDQLNLLKTVRDAGGQPANQTFNTLVADDCQNRGWITTHSEGAFALTPAGRKVLADAE